MVIEKISYRRVNPWMIQKKLLTELGKSQASGTFLVREELLRSTAHSFPRVWSLLLFGAVCETRGQEGKRNRQAGHTERGEVPVCICHGFLHRKPRVFPKVSLQQ